MKVITPREALDVSGGASELLHEKEWSDSRRLL